MPSLRMGIAIQEWVHRASITTHDHQLRQLLAVFLCLFRRDIGEHRSLRRLEVLGARRLEERLRLRPVRVSA